ncbi:MAG: ABC transporter ATP-binding protein/permease [Lachnospiraceae bacterium]|nr:ABC transporter ATP-binding protein/permease [Lachnospiraceae bacterium]
MGFIKKRIQEGRMSELKSQVKWVLRYARRYWKHMIIYTVIGLSGTLVALISGFVSRDMVDIITGHKVGAVLAQFASLIMITLLNTLIGQISEYVSLKINLKVSNEIKEEIFGGILMADWEALSDYHTGDLLTRWNTDSAAVASGVLTFFPNIVIYSTRFISALVVMVSSDWTFAVISMISIPFSFVISKQMMKKMRNANQESSRQSAQLNGFNQETFSNIQTVKAFSLIPEYIKRLHKLQAEYITMKLKFQRGYIGITLINVLISLIISYAAYGWGIYRVWSEAITYGTMTMFLTLSSTLSSAMSSMMSLVPSALYITNSAQRLMDLVELPKEDYSNESDVKEFAEKNADTGISLCIKDMDYSYKNGNEIFCGASIDAAPHETIALVGPSGEGKTTMLRLILALINKKDGEAVLYGDKYFTTEDGREEKSIPLNAAARQLFSYVPQGNTMLSGTIADNMRFVKSDATDEEIWAALDMACAKEFVEKMPNGIDSELKERGGGISEGQAQRLSIARAIIRKSPLLLLDEATSALDVATERRVLNNIMKDDYPRTCIVTTHRPTVLNVCNRVYAIKDKKFKVLNEEEIDEMIKGF